MERERVTVQQAAARLGITESAVRKRVRKGDLRSEKVLEGNRERLYVFLDPDAEPFPEPFREKYMRSLEDRDKTLEDEVMRQQAIILSMSQSVRALTGAPEAPQSVEEAPQSVEEAQEGAEPRPSNAPSMYLACIPGTEQAKQCRFVPCEATLKAPPGLFGQFRNIDSRKFVCRILHIPARYPWNHPPQAPRTAPPR